MSPFSVVQCPISFFDMPKSFQYHISVMEEIRLTEKVKAGG